MLELSPFPFAHSLRPDPTHAPTHTQGRSSLLCEIFLGTLPSTHPEACCHGGSKAYGVDKITILVTEIPPHS